MADLVELEPLVVGRDGGLPNMHGQSLNSRPLGSDTMMEDSPLSIQL
jgi:hypothetical protein